MYKVEKIGKEIWLNWNIKQFNFCWEDIPPLMKIPLDC